MVKLSGNAIFFAVIFVVILAIDGFLIAMIVIEANKLTQCETQQSIFCPTLTCNDPSGVTPTNAGTSCYPYAYRYPDPTDISNFVCNFPSNLSPIVPTAS